MGGKNIAVFMRNEREKRWESHRCNVTEAGDGGGEPLHPAEELHEKGKEIRVELVFHLVLHDGERME